MPRHSRPANNQLADDSVADLLDSRGITWAPDPVVSAGSIVAAVAGEITHLPEPEVHSLLAGIGDRLGNLLDEAAKDGQTPPKVARQQVRMRLTPSRPPDLAVARVATWRHGSVGGASATAGDPGRCRDT
jgi:glutamate dehydrogenase/leucine dehydrogenase